MWGGLVVRQLPAWSVVLHELSSRIPASSFLCLLCSALVFPSSWGFQLAYELCAVCGSSSLFLGKLTSLLTTSVRDCLSLTLCLVLSSLTPVS